MDIRELFEANIPIRDTEKQARAAILPLIKEHLSALWDHYLERFPDITSQEDWGEDRFRLFDDFRENLMSHSETFVNGLLWKPQQTLSRLATERAGEPVRVSLDCRQFSQDTHKHYGGYFNREHDAYLIKCFVDEIGVREAASEALHEIVFGEAYDTGMDVLANKIVSVFVHEFVHLEQELRNPHRPHRSGLTNDPGITTVGGGKRGNRRDPRGGHIGWARYTGSLKEIEAFASQTASEMIAGISLSHFQTEPDDGQINNLLTDLALGWGSGVAFHAMAHMRTYWEDFEKAGVKASERDRVWQRYMKLTYQKVWQFRREKLGRTPAYHEYSTGQNKVWLKVAKKGMIECAHQIAYDVAFQCYWEASSYRTPEQLAAHDALAQKGIGFMEDYFFGGYENSAVESMKVQVSMQKLIAKKIRQLADENQIKDIAA